MSTESGQAEAEAVARWRVGSDLRRQWCRGQLRRAVRLYLRLEAAVR